MSQSGIPELNLWEDQDFTQLFKSIYPKFQRRKLMSPRKAAPQIDESRFQKLIRRGGLPSANLRQAPARATVLLRLDADLLERLDAKAEGRVGGRHALIVEILSSWLRAGSPMRKAKLARTEEIQTERKDSK